MTTYFTSDLHFNHENIILFCGRPFKSLGEMNYELTRCWNNVVTKNDTVYVIGDFAMGDPEHWKKFCSRLNGTKILVRGNHDKGHDFMREVGFAEVHENIIINIDGISIWMNHYPVDNSLDKRSHLRPKAPGPYDIAICGHIHQHWKVKAKCVNVGVDVWDFKPITQQDILDAIRDEVQI